MKINEKVVLIISLNTKLIHLEGLFSPTIVPLLTPYLTILSRNSNNELAFLSSHILHNTRMYYI
jgi:hypothetical protein